MGGLKQVPERWPRRRSSKLSWGLLLLFCVLAMHGFQASPSPTEMTGVPLTSMSAGHHDPAPMAAANHRAAGDDQPGHHHNDHPGGGICLAILTMLLLVMTAVALYGRKPIAVVVRILTRTRILLVGRPPPRPSLHRLSVLRL
ncbi:DUF6153 family protein [Spirillospora sp. CA-142024]|uniref:DUF6153 family protein n=1 Tax=Spirillospora sp. CA-142024 TaxID=3240036 RepID=UPI003D918586